LNYETILPMKGAQR